MCTLYLPDSSPNILPHAYSPNPFSAQRQQSIARLAKRIETWTRREMVKKKASASLPLAVDISSSSDNDDAWTPPSDSDITPHEAKMLAHLRRPDHALIEMGHATLRNLIREARTRLAEVETLLDATATTAEEAEEAEQSTSKDGEDMDKQEMGVENKLQELLGLLHEFDEKLTTWTDVITGRDGFDESVGSMRQEMERKNERGLNTGAAAMPAAVREPRVELSNLRRAREELRIGTDVLLERRKERSRLGEKVEGWLADLGSYPAEMRRELESWGLWDEGSVPLRHARWLA
ncbi:hypothetical protein H2199_002799 [Coniosporium tulheliwenetii]|uniref:Uncharacterized protein n=1 Tax=Coniosporium tulheliwenetii TaxID=3383036 RepID=A0ACC2ZEQ1_9PEZI|nr:hypothetical protein H2199_002799 [Cladosporium sp. JES 115]